MPPSATRHRPHGPDDQIAPQLRPPREVPRRRIGASPRGGLRWCVRIAHIELNAIDLALDMACRYVAHRLPRDFYTDWLSVADDEARHFLMLTGLPRWMLVMAICQRMMGCGRQPGKTADDLLGRLAIAPLVLEARGLDVTPAMIERLQAVADPETAAAFTIIMNDEIVHVAIGKKWFDYVCGMQRRDPCQHLASACRHLFPGAAEAAFQYCGAHRQLLSRILRSDGGAD